MCWSYCQWQQARGAGTVTNWGPLTFRRLLRGPLPLVHAGAPARDVQPSLLRPAVLQDVLRVQPVSRQGAGGTCVQHRRAAWSTPGRVRGRWKLGEEKPSGALIYDSVHACVCVCVCVSA